MNENIERLLRYLEFKAECAAYQELNPVRLNYDLAVDCRDRLEIMKGEKVEEIKPYMPKVPKYSIKTRPKITHKKDGTLSSHGEKWYRLLRKEGLPMTYKGEVKVLAEYLEPNPMSVPQVKDWLFSLGWEPRTFKYVKEDDGERKIPQIRKDGLLCESVVKLQDKNPGVSILEGLTVIQHRLGIFKAFVEHSLEKDGKYYLKARIEGLTNTLRFKHANPLVNLPGVDKPWGKEIRSCLIAEEGEEFLGADLSSLEATTKRHYIYPHDPDYADEMSKEGFDEHLDLALKNGVITQEDYDSYTTSDNPEAQYPEVHKVRKEFKPVNYSAVYGIGVPKLARGMGITSRKAKMLLSAYWKRNWAVKVVAGEQYVKTHHGYDWLYNPVSGFFYELRYDKDRFSTLNQGTGVYIFDSWLARAKKLGYMGQMQFHDETGASVKDGSRTREVLLQAIENLNTDLKCHVSFGVEVKLGMNYAETH